MARKKASTLPTGSYRLRWGKRLLHCSSRTDAKKSAEHFIRAGAKEIEIQERYPSGTWVTTDIVMRTSLPLDY